MFITTRAAPGCAEEVLAASAATYRAARLPAESSM